LKNIIPSAARISAVGKYIVALSASLASIDEGAAKTVHDRGTPARRKKLHLLYLLNDLLHHTRYHAESPSAYSVLTGNLQSYLVDLFSAASTYGMDTHPKHHQKIEDLLRLWQERGYYQTSYIDKLRESVKIAATADHEIAALCRPSDSQRDHNLAEEKRDTPYIMPASHGDPSTPYYDLPAANMMPHIVPNSSNPISSHMVKPLQFVAGPADQTLVAFVKDFLKQVSSTDGLDLESMESGTVDLDELGQYVLRDVSTNEVVRGQGYYGWSQDFCEKMKSGANIESFRKGIGHDDYDDRSSSPRKRARRSFSPSTSRSRSRTMSRSPSRGRFQRFRSPSRSPSRPRSYSPPPPPRVYSQGQPSANPLFSQSVPQVPPSDIPTFAMAPDTQQPEHMQAQAYNPSPSPHSMPIPPSPFTSGFPIGPGGVPIPPRPQNYNGPWPPPPPPPMNPREYQNSGPPPFANGSMGYQPPPGNPNYGWRPQLENLSDPGASYQHGAPSQPQHPYDSLGANGRGRGYGRGPFAR